MNRKEKPLDPCQGEAAQKNTPSQNYPPIDALCGWFDLSATTKESRTERRQKRGWKRGRQ